MYDLVIGGGQIVTEAGPCAADVGVVGSQIAAIGQDLSGKKRLAADGCFVIPGGVDPHVHLQMKLGNRVSSDTFAAGTVAAICGGTTTVIDFVTPGPGEALLDALATRRREADGTVAADYSLHMTLPTWHAATAERLSELKRVVAAGCPTFKIYQAYAEMVLDDVALLRAFTLVAEAGGSVVLHSEIGPVIEYLRLRALIAGHTSPIWHERTRPAALEASAVRRAIDLATLADCPLHIFHVSAQLVVEEIARLQASGSRLTAETCPHYLCLTADSHLAGDDGALYVCAPPLRTHQDQESLWQGLADGCLDVISTDHCPWLYAEKQADDFTQIPGGLPGIESRLALLYDRGVRTNRMSLQRWLEVCCMQPAQLMGLHHKGRLLPGFDADLVIFDPDKRKEICADTLHETAGWTPYQGMIVHGWPRSVLLRGQLVVQDGKVIEPTAGQFVSRTLS